LRLAMNRFLRRWPTCGAATSSFVTVIVVFNRSGLVPEEVPCGLGASRGVAPLAMLPLSGLFDRDRVNGNCEKRGGVTN
jgi:hypothetical protein